MPRKKSEKNIRMVADLAKVSIATVSRTMNNETIVSPSTRARVKRAIRAIGYRPSRRERRSISYGMVIPMVTNPFYASITDRLERLSFELGRRIYFICAHNSPSQELKGIARLRKDAVDGIFVIPQNTSRAHINALLKHRLPMVLLTRISSSLPSISVDHSEGGRLVAEHFFTQGITDIAYVGPITDDEDKYMGFNSYLNSRGVHIKPKHLFNTENETMTIDDFVRSLIKRGKPTVRGIFCINDIYACRITAELHGRRIATPQDVTIIGFDNSKTAEELGITSIEQPLDEMAKLAYDELNKSIERRRSGKRMKLEGHTPHILSPRLICRDTSLDLRKLKKMAAFPNRIIRDKRR